MPMTALALASDLASDLAAAEKERKKERKKEREKEKGEGFHQSIGLMDRRPFCRVNRPLNAGVGAVVVAVDDDSDLTAADWVVPFTVD